MSANIYWRPVEESGHDLEVHAPSSFIQVLEEAFGPLPVKIEKSDLPILKGIRAGVDSFAKESITSLMEAVEMNEVVEVYAKW